MKTIHYTSAVIKQRRKLTSDVRKRIDEKLARYAETGEGDVIRLTGRDGSRLRVGDWRVIFDEDAETISVFAIGHRREIYD